MQVCAITNKKPPSKQKKKRSKRNMSAVTHALILKKFRPLPGAFILAIRAISAITL
jgi:hypothetical protein